MKTEKIKLKNIEKSHKITDKKKIPIKKSISKYGFNYGLGYIIIDNKNRIIDGHHRYQSLLEIKGGEFEILVKKSKFTFSQFYILYFLKGSIGLLIIILLLIKC
jgi:hypothetical protein